MCFDALVLYRYSQNFELELKKGTKCFDSLVSCEVFSLQFKTHNVNYTGRSFEWLVCEDVYKRQVLLKDKLDYKHPSYGRGASERNPPWPPVA